jgi:hypothetical protein
MNKCKCGSRKFVTTIHLEIRDVPVTMDSSGGAGYDDTKGESSGWDINEEPEITCPKCGRLYRLENTGKKNKYGNSIYTLKDMGGK